MRVRALGFLSVCAALLVVCADPAFDETADPGLVRYTLDWDLAGATPHADGGHLFTTASQTRVWLARGWLVSYSAELVQCDVAEADAGLPSWLAPRALAGHGDPYDSEARFVTPVAEDLATPDARTWGQAVVPDYAFCQAHYLIARGDETTTVPEDGPNLAQVSLTLEGQWERDDGTWAPFALRVQHATGTLQDIGMVETGAAAIDVRITRRLAGLLDGVDFATLDPVLTARQVLRNLREQTTVRVTPLPP